MPALWQKIFFFPFSKILNNPNNYWMMTAEEAGEIAKTKSVERKRRRQQCGI
jgi:hypothetical protein